MKFSKTTYSQIPKPLPPIDAETERLVSEAFSKHIIAAMGIPESVLNPPSTFEGGGRSLTLDDLKRFRQFTPTRKKDFIINIDDVVSWARYLRKEGYRLQRGYAVTGAKGAFFFVEARSQFGYNPIATLYVDIWRHTPRGQLIAFNADLPKPLGWRR